jgi:hypothetical protein
MGSSTRVPEEVLLVTECLWEGGRRSGRGRGAGSGWDGSDAPIIFDWCVRCRCFEIGLNFVEKNLKGEGIIGIEIGRCGVNEDAGS